MFDLYMDFMGANGMLITFALAAIVGIGCIIWQKIDERNEQRAYRDFYLGKEVEDAEKRRFEKMGF